MFLRHFRPHVLLLVLVLAVLHGNLARSPDTAEHLHEETRSPELAWAGVIPAGHAEGNGPGDSTGVAPAITGVVAQEADLRVGPGTTYDTITRLVPGASVRIQLRHETWFKVAAVDGTEGWLSDAQITFTQGAAEDVPIASYVPPAPPAPEAPPVEEQVPAEVTDPAVDEQPAPEAPQAPAEEPETPGDEQPIPEEPKAPTKEPEQPAPPPRPAANKPGTPAPAATMHWVWPTRGTITSRFGYRTLGGRRQFHNGLDIANRKWTAIIAASEGTVSEAGWCSGYGYCVKIKHSDGLISEYGHMAAKPPVRAGQVVPAGSLIGYMGSTYDRAGGGYATGVHLHFTLRLNGRAVSPLIYLP